MEPTKVPGGGWGSATPLLVGSRSSSPAHSTLLERLYSPRGSSLLDLNAKAIPERLKNKAMDVLIDYFFPGECYHKVFEKYQFFDHDCLSIALSRYLSFSIILGAIGVKLPQIFKVLKNYSAEGLSYIATILELGAVTFSCTYNFNKGFPFSTWGESFFISIQVIVILILMAIIRRHTLPLFICVVLYSCAAWYLVSGLAPASLIAALQAMVIPLVMASRMTTIMTIFQNGYTGQLSFITAILNFLGTIARVFTTIQETGDVLLVVTFLTSMVLNGIIVLQFLWYWNVSAKPIYKKE